MQCAACGYEKTKPQVKTYLDPSNPPFLELTSELSGDDTRFNLEKTTYRHDDAGDVVYNGMETVSRNIPLYVCPKCGTVKVDMSNINLDL